MTKLVNIYPVYPVIAVNPPIRSTVRRVSKSTAEIRACLMARARVEEILPDGKLVTLTLSNYDQDNNPAHKKVEEPEEQKAPIVEDKKPEFKPNQNNNYYGGGKHKNKHNRNNFNNNYAAVEQKPVETPKEQTKLETVEPQDSETPAPKLMATEPETETHETVTENGVEIETMDLEELGL